MELFKLLEEYTNSDMGEWYLSYNEHHTNYINEKNYPDDFEQRVLDNYIDKDQCGEYYDEEVEDFKKYVTDFHNVYELNWYNRNPVGSYTFYGSSLELIEEQVKEFIERHKNERGFEFV